MKRKIVLPLLLLLALPPSVVLAGPQPGDPAPNFSLPDTTWTLRQLTEFRGRVVLLNFWTSG